MTIQAERLKRDTALWVQIVVADNGIGFLDSEREHLFEKYASPPAVPRTNGRGLASVKRIIRCHQGTIICQSGQTEKGARFVIELPQCQEPPTSSAQQRRGPRSALILGLFSDLSTGRKTMLDEKRVLVCEDHPTTAQRIKAKVEEAFPCATVEIASTAEEVTQEAR